MQIAKDYALKAATKGSTEEFKPIWHFLDGPPDIDLRKLLDKAEIPYVVYTK